jgi:hypothetical protein
VLTLMGYRVQSAAGAAASVTVTNDVSNGGYAMTIAIRANTTVGALMRVGGVTIVKRFSSGDTVTWSAPTGGSVSGTVAGIVLDSAAPTHDHNSLAGSDWGLGGRFQNIANLAADAWVGGRATIAATDFTAGITSLSFSISNASAARMGANGCAIILASSSGNWAAYRLRKPVDMSNAATHTRFFDAATATTIASAGTVNLAAITEIYIMYHRKSGHTLTCSLTFKNLVILTEATICGSATAGYGFQSIANLVNGWCDGLWISSQGNAQTLIRQKLRIGDGTNKTVFNSSASSLEAPIRYDEANKLLDLDADVNKIGLTLFTTANDSITFDSSIQAYANRNTFTINPSSATPAAFSTSGLSMIGLTPTWKTGFNPTGLSVSSCDEIDAKASTWTGCTIKASISTGSAMKIDAGASLASCAFTKGAETYAIRIPAAGTYSLASTTFTGYTTALNVTAASGTVTINLATGQTAPTYTSAGATVAFVYPQLTASVTGIVAGSRIQVYNVTTATEVANAIVAGTSWTLNFYNGAEFTVGDTVRIRLTCQSGTTACQQWTTNAVVGTTGFSVLSSQENHPAYTLIGIDGSTVTEFALDNPNIQFDANDPDGVSTKKRMVAWFYYAVTTEPGIRDFFRAIVLEDEANAVIDPAVVNLKIDNVSTQQLRFSDTDFRLYAKDGSSWIKYPSTGGYGIHNDSGKVYVGTANTPTAVQIRQEIDSNSTKLDVAVSTRNATTPPTAAANATAVRSELATELARIDAAVSSRSTYAGGDTSGTTTLLSRVTDAVMLASSYTAPANADIAAIKAKTDNLPSDPADQSLLIAAIGSPLQAGSYTAPLDATATQAAAAAALSAYDAATGSDVAGVPTAPTVTQIREEMDSNSVKLATIDSITKTTLAVSA